MKIVRGLVLECFKSSTLVPPSTLLSRSSPIALSSPVFLPSFFSFFLLVPLVLLLPARRLGTSCILHGRVLEETNDEKHRTTSHGNRMYLPFLRACINLPLGYVPLVPLASKNVPPLIKYLLRENIEKREVKRRVSEITGFSSHFESIEFSSTEFYPHPPSFLSNLIRDSFRFARLLREIVRDIHDVTLTLQSTWLINGFVRASYTKRTATRSDRH